MANFCLSDFEMLAMRIAFGLGIPHDMLRLLFDISSYISMEPDNSKLDNYIIQ
jgi:hypothetical protein